MVDASSLFSKEEKIYTLKNACHFHTISPLPNLKIPASAILFHHQVQHFIQVKLLFTSLKLYRCILISHAMYW